MHRQFTKRFAQRLQHSIWPAKLALPDDEYIPPCLLQSADRCLIPIDIGVELGLPESGARLGEHGVPAAWMTMPEATVYKDAHFKLGQYNVRLSRQILPMQPVTVALGMQEPAHNHFGLRVLPSDPRHHQGSLGRLNDVHFKQFRYSVVS